MVYELDVFAVQPAIRNLGVSHICLARRTTSMMGEILVSVGSLELSEIADHHGALMSPLSACILMDRKRRC